MGAPKRGRHAISQDWLAQLSIRSQTEFQMCASNISIDIVQTGSRCHDVTSLDVGQAGVKVRRMMLYSHAAVKSSLSNQGDAEHQYMTVNIKSEPWVLGSLPAGMLPQTQYPAWTSSKRYHMPLLAEPCKQQSMLLHSINNAAMAQFNTTFVRQS